MSAEKPWILTDGAVNREYRTEAAAERALLANGQGTIWPDLDGLRQRIHTAANALAAASDPDEKRRATSKLRIARRTLAEATA